MRAADLARLDELQERLYAEDRRALLVVFQAMDAAGKDGTIEHVMSGVNPQGVRVTSFKQPTQHELAHDWLWRYQVALPARGEIGIFNRSHYEEVLVVRVHPEYLARPGERPGARRDEREFWDAAATRTSPRGSATCTARGTRIVKFFLHVSRDEQRERFLARAAGARQALEVLGRRRRRARALGRLPGRPTQATLKATSTEHAPWYVIPADHKWLMRTAVAAILVHHLEAMDPQVPTLSDEDAEEMKRAVAELEAEAG